MQIIVSVSSCDAHTFAFTGWKEYVSFLLPFEEAGHLPENVFLSCGQMKIWTGPLNTFKVAHGQKNTLERILISRKNKSQVSERWSERNYRWNSKHCRGLLKEVKSSNIEIILHLFLFCHIDWASWITCPALYILTLLSSSLEFQSLHFSLHLVSIPSPLLFLL